FADSDQYALDGHHIYDGPAALVDVTFHNFNGDDDAIVRSNAVEPMVSHTYDGIAFVNTAFENAADFGSVGTIPDPYKIVAAIDIDGSLTGIAGAQILPLRKSDGFYETQNTYEIAEWSALVSPDARLGNFVFHDDGPNDAEFRVSRESGATKGWDGTEDGQGRAHHGFFLNGETYKLELRNSNDEFDVHVMEIPYGESVTYEIHGLDIGTQFTEIEEFSRDDDLTIREVSSLEMLEASYDTAVYRDVEDDVIFVKFVAEAKIGWHNANPGNTYDDELYTGAMINIDQRAENRVDVSNLAFDDPVGTADMDYDGTSGDDLFYAFSGNDDVRGGSGNDTLFGGIGDDFVHGGGGNDALYGNSGHDDLRGRDGDDLLVGNSGDDELRGDGGNDTLDGGEGEDVLIGGTGDDTYIVNDTLDQLVENEGGGTDMVQASVTYRLWQQSSFIEGLTLTGMGDIDGYGNGANNTLIGNHGNNFLSGGGGADTLNGGLGADRLDGGSGADVMTGGAGDDVFIVDHARDSVIELAGEGTDTVEASVSLRLWQQSQDLENLTLTGTADIDATGNSLANVLTGNAGSNTLNGAIGADTMIGGAGDDTYVVDNGFDSVIELAGEGTDSVLSSTNFRLWQKSQNIENLTLTGTANVTGDGNALANTITGNAGNNSMNGGYGNDTLDGAEGSDRLTGGFGDDLFVLHADQSAGDADTVTDFSGNDAIRIDGAASKAIAFTQVGNDTQ
ncbi:MAG: calcium-binding protein, partial [Pseudomonadota bacterium]